MSQVVSDTVGPAKYGNGSARKTMDSYKVVPRKNHHHLREASCEGELCWTPSIFIYHSNWHIYIVGLAEPIYLYIYRYLGNVLVRAKRQESALARAGEWRSREVQRPSPGREGGSMEAPPEAENIPFVPSPFFEIETYKYLQSWALSSSDDFIF